MQLFSKFKKAAMKAHPRKLRAVKRVSRHPAFRIPLVTFSLLLLVTAVGIVLFSGGAPKLKDAGTHVVIVTDKKEERAIPTRAQTVGELLEKAEIKLQEGDVVEPARETEIVSDNFRVNVYRAVPVTIVDGSNKVFAYSAASTPRSIVKQAGIEVFPEDDLALLPVDNFLTEGSIGERVVIQRATPVHVNIYGTQVSMRTHAKTVGELVKERGIKMSGSDSIQPTANVVIKPDMQIFLIRKGTQIATEEVAIPMHTEIVEDTSLSFGSTALRQQGSDGKKLVTYQLQLENGKEISRKLIQEVITTQPVTQITARGKAVQIPSDKQAIMAAAGIASSDYPYVEYIISHENALWCPTRWQGQRNCPLYYEEKYPGAESDRTLGYGLCQSTPANKMATAGSDWRTNVVTQMKWCSNYAKGRYGTWEAAYNYWVSHHNW